MHSLPHYTAVILDMDGLVLDTEKTYRIAWQSATRAMGFELSDAVFMALAGLQYVDVERLINDQCGENFNIDDFRKISTEHWLQYVEKNGIAVKPGFFELMRVIEEFQLPCCLATNSLQKNAEQCLQLAGIDDCFQTLVTRDQVSHGKPAPDIFVKAADVMEQQTANCLIVEDSLTGVQAACRAGGIVIYIPENNDRVKIPYPVVQLNDLNHLADLLQAH